MNKKFQVVVVPTLVIMGSLLASVAWAGTAVHKPSADCVMVRVVKQGAGDVLQACRAWQATLPPADRYTPDPCAVESDSYHACVSVQMDVCAGEPLDQDSAEWLLCAPQN